MDKIRQNSFLKISIGIVYFWFGVLKFFPELSPAEGLATDTISELTLGLIPAKISIILLALLEVGIGICFLLNIHPKNVAIAALAHMACTFTPLFFFNEISFNGYPIFLTLVGQYIIKNLIIIAALLSIIKERNHQVRSTKIIEK
jgi:uncharacterized membrane protein YkgB